LQEWRTNGTGVEIPFSTNNTNTWQPQGVSPLCGQTLFVKEAQAESNLKGVLPASLHLLEHGKS
jgi:hypothetical protein